MKSILIAILLLAGCVNLPPLPQSLVHQPENEARFAELHWVLSPTGEIVEEVVLK